MTVRGLARSALRFALRSARLRAILTSEIARLERPRSAAPRTTLARTTFTDRHGTDHPLDVTLRDRLKPAWRSMCDPTAAALPPTDDHLAASRGKAARSVTEMERLLAVTAGAALTGRILEIGCFDGAAAFESSKRAGTSVVASDLARYYVTQRPGQPEASALAEEEARLAVIRERARELAGVPPGRVEFVEDDITSSSLAPGTFDLICSFEVLEHLLRPAEAFAAMAALLRPGGVMYHDYNPFFSSIGGHSLGTLDLPWGHARFDADDLARYLREVRPTEAEQAMRFLAESLNRMTLDQLRTAIDGAGLELLAVIPWNERALVPRLEPEILAEVRRVHPTATTDDLLAKYVSVAARRPDVGAVAS